MEVLELTDPRWSQLKATYSNGTTVAKHLSALRSGHLSKENEEDFWQELCHQDDATEAGYAAIPHLVVMAEQAEGEQASFLLAMAAHVLACSTFGSSHRIPDFLRPGIKTATQRALLRLSRFLAGEGLPDSEANVKALVSTIVGFHQKTELYVAIERLDCPVKCPRCGNLFSPDEPAQAIKAKT